MTMKKIISWGMWPVLAAPLVYLAIVWNRIPETVALHFDLQGKPDRFGSKKELIGLAAILTAMNLFCYFLLTNIYRIDPKKHAAENRERLRRIAFAVVVFISAILFMIIHSSMIGDIEISMGFIFSGVGLLFAVIGNYMSNMKPNYFAGFRLPWTLEDEDNWKRTHAIAGKLWFGGGLLLAIVCLFTPPVASIVIFFSVTMIMVIIPLVVSYRIYKRKKAAGAAGQRQ
jgi:uncharacterized membrane protein